MNTLESPPKRVCSWCKTTLQPGIEPATHTICPICLSQMLSDEPQETKLGDIAPERNMSLESPEQRFRAFQREEDLLGAAVVAILLGIGAILAMLW